MSLAASLALSPAPRVIAYTPLPKTPPGPALIRTMSPPNDEIGVNSETDVAGAAVGYVDVVVGAGVVTVTVPRLSLVGVVAGVNVAWSGKTVTVGASRQRSSSPSIDLR